MEHLILLGGGAGAYCVIRIVKYLYESFNAPIISRPLSWMGKNSMEMLCLRLFELNMVPWNKLLDFCGIHNNAFIAIFVCKMLWAVLGVITIKKIKGMCSGRELNA